MTVNDFFVKYNGKPVDFDHYYGNQCVDLYRQFVKECLVYPQSPGVTGAADIWNTYLKDYYLRIDNTPDGVPQLGDVVIWNKSAGGGFGHVAVFSSGDTNNFISYDQNWPVGSYCHFQNHNYTNVLGWLRPNKFIEEQPQPPVSVITDQTRIPQIQNKEVQQIKAELEAKDQNIAEILSINGGLNATVESLTFQLNVKEQELEKCKETSPGTPGTSQEPQFTNPLAKLFYNLAKALG